MSTSDRTGSSKGVAGLVVPTDEQAEWAKSISSRLSKMERRPVSDCEARAIVRLILAAERYGNFHTESLAVMERELVAILGEQGVSKRRPTPIDATCGSGHLAIVALMTLRSMKADERMAVTHAFRLSAVIKEMTDRLDWLDALKFRSNMDLLRAGYMAHAGSTEDRKQEAIEAFRRIRRQQPDLNKTDAYELAGQEIGVTGRTVQSYLKKNVGSP